MVNLKHALSAIAAVAMVGSLAANQAAEITSVNAEKASMKISYQQPEVLAGDGEGVVAEDITETVTVKKKEEIKEEVKETAEVSEQTEAVAEEQPVVQHVVIENEKAYVLITEAFLNMRADASTEAEVVAQLECAAEVTILSENEEWYQVQYQDKTGYVAKQFVTKSKEEADKALLDNFKYESGFVNQDGVNIRDNAGTEGTNVVDQVAANTLIFIIERVDAEWLKVYYGENYDIGYVMSSFVTVDDLVDKEAVTNAKINRINAIAKKGEVSSNGTKLNVRALPNDDSEIIDTLEDGTAVRIVTKGSKWTKIAIGNGGKTAYVKSEYVLDENQIAQREAAKKAAEEKKQKEAAEKKQKEDKEKQSKKENKQKEDKKTEEKKTETTTVSSKGSASGQAIVNAASKYIGVRYVYGGNSPSTGFDCSGLVQYACRQVGISVNRSSRQQYSNGVAVSRSNLQPGDLIFFSKGKGISHVVIYAGNGKVIHAPSPGKTVCYASLDYICSYSNYVGARRVA